ncbi:MAG: oligopeptide transport system ATP-binding protein [Lysobacterales bacterium]|jgi:oligopeptide transport system ATP-binding protein
MLLELKNITKSFSQQGVVVKAVDNVSLVINESENIGLVGESGCGKTTLARIIIKLYGINSGQIIFDGTDVTKFSQGKFRPLRKRLQMVFQDPYSSLDSRFTVRSILKEALDLDKKRYKSEQEMEQVMIHLLKDVHLDGDILNRYPHEFSGGERQRIAIARALILNPKLLILDEAVSSLDVLVQDQILTLLRDLQKRYNMTYLFISHNLKVVQRICDRIAVMYKGKIVELGPSDAIFNNPQHPYTQDLLKAAIQYRSTKRTEAIEVPEWGELVEREKGHFVIGK